MFSFPVSITSPDITISQRRKLEIGQLIQLINSEREKDAQIKHPGLADKMESPSEKCCYISIDDDIGVKHQNDHRGDNRSKDDMYVENTVIHMQADEKTYFLTTIRIDQAFSVLFAFLLKNRLIDDRILVFFSDGARNIKNCIESVFGFTQFTIVLDWFHQKRNAEYLSVLESKAQKKQNKKSFSIFSVCCGSGMQRKHAVTFAALNNQKAKANIG